MAVKAIAHSYWRSIKRGARTFESVLDPVKEDVRTLARADVADGASHRKSTSSTLARATSPPTKPFKSAKGRKKKG